MCPPTVVAPEYQMYLFIWPVTTRASADTDHARSDFFIQLPDMKRNRMTQPVSVVIGSQWGQSQIAVKQATHKKPSKCQPNSKLQLFN